MRKLLEIGTGRHPFQVAVVAACPLSSLAVLITGSPPASLAAALPSPLGDVWLAALATGGLTALLGAYWSGDLDAGLLIEGAGISTLAAALTIYATALFLVSGNAAAAAGGFLLALAVAAWWRLGQIARDVRKVWRAQREGLTAQVRILVDPDHPAPPPAAGAGAR